MIPVKIEMTIWKISIVQKPEGVQGTKKNEMLSTTSAAFTRMNVVFLPSLLAIGTQSATPAIFDTSPTPRNNPE